MAKTHEIRQALVDSLKRAPGLSAVGEWHKVDGFVPSRKHPTGYIGSGSTTYDQQDADWDLASTELPVLLCVVDSNPEQAEDQVQALGEEARLHLVVDDPTLGGAVRGLDVTQLVFDTADADGPNLLAHFVTLQVAVSHFVPRFRTLSEPPADVIELEIEGEG